MRLVVWNIRYGTGFGPSFHLPLPGAGYLRSNRPNVQRITDYLTSTQPDIVGLLEVDTGSIRSGINQAESIGEALGHYSTYQCKYGQASINQRVPVLRNQSNAFLCKPSVTDERFHYFDTGVKRLVIELELDDVAIFLVHLSVKYRHRQAQLRHLHELISATDKPVIVAGDFNTFGGADEMYLFCQAACLTSANPNNLLTYPSRSPRHELDFVLYGEGIQPQNFEVTEIDFSDHRPLIFDFTVDPASP
ncbi:MAG: endonuclease/exonuclease/phosphatase family protein [Gammaproteobacteria bacterium]